ACGFTLVATRGTAAHLRAAGLPAETINKVQEGSPHIVDALRRGEVSLVVNTPAGAESFRDSFPIRRTALECRVPYFTTIAAAAAAAPLAELDDLLATLRREPSGAHEPALRRAHALLPALREAAGAPAAWTEYRPAAGPVEPALAALGQSVEAVRAVGPKRGTDLARFGLGTVEDLLYHLPFRYEDRRALRPLATLQVGEEATAVGEVTRAREGRVGRRGRRILEVVLRDPGGVLLLVWFHQIPYFSRRLSPGQRLVVHGKVEPPLGAAAPRMIHPEIETLGPDEPVAARVLPVYEKPTEMHVGAMRRIVHAAVEEFADRAPSALPAEVAA